MSITDLLSADDIDAALQECQGGWVRGVKVGEMGWCLQSGRDSRLKGAQDETAFL